MEKKFDISLVLTALGVVFGVLLGRLFYLQIISKAELGAISSQNSVRKISTDAPRGLMFDRNGEILVDNQPLYTLTITPSAFDKKNLPFLSSLIGLSEKEILDRINDGASYNKFAPAKILRDLPPVQLARVEENLWQLPGVNFTIENKRRYPFVRAAHAFGYAKSISKPMLEKLPKDIYSRDDIIGYSGLEKNYEEVVRGSKGSRLVMVNSLGKWVGDFEDGKQNIPYEVGNDLYLTLDKDLQAAAESLLVATGKSGAIVAMDTRTGELLAFASEPNYDLNLFGGFTSSNAWAEILKDPKNPLFDRVTQTRYPPGSTYKMMLAIAALEEKIATPQTTFYCSGHFKFGNKDFLCHRGNGHGACDMRRAIQVSCNSYFYNMMLRVGFERWTKYGRMFGFGQKTGVDVSDEQTATLPSPEFFDKIYGKNGWTAGYLISLGIGQGEMGASPIQMVRYTAALGNGGILHQPHLVSGYRDRKTGSRIELSFDSKNLPISATTFQVVREGMLAAVEEGTGGASKVEGINVAGKTGTAQNAHGEDHAWFIGFAPYDKPTIAVVALVENAGFGGKIAAPIAGEIMKKYFRKYPATGAPLMPPADSLNASPKPAATNKLADAVR
jgi:penicillin-binding protein 2